MTVPKFPVTCPNGHEVGVGFTLDELKAWYADNTLKFHCPRCDTSWKPTEKERANLLRWLEKHST